MKTKFFSILFLAILVTACKKNDSPDAALPKPIEEKPVEKNFKIILDVLVKKDDNFQVYYTQTATENFTEEKSIWVAVKGSEELQKVVFDLPAGVAPNLLRLDFGLNKDQQDIKFSEVNMEYAGKKFTANGGMIGNYFRPLEPTVLDIKTGMLWAKDKDGKRIEPVLYPHEVPLGREIAKLTK
jgi:hypothetical protein